MDEKNIDTPQEPPIKKNKTPWIVIVVYVIIDQQLHFSDHIVDSFAARHSAFGAILKIIVSGAIGYLLMHIYQNIKDLNKQDDVPTSELAEDKGIDTQESTNADETKNIDYSHGDVMNDNFANDSNDTASCSSEDVQFIYTNTDKNLNNTDGILSEEPRNNGKDSNTRNIWRTAFILLAIATASACVIFFLNDRNVNIENQTVVLDSFYPHAPAPAPTPAPIQTTEPYEKQTTTEVFGSDKRYSIVYDNSIWSTSEKTIKEDADISIVNNEGNVFAFSIIENIPISYNEYKKIAYSNMPDSVGFNITYEDRRISNGTTVDFFSYQAHIGTFDFIYYVYFYSGKSYYVTFTVFTFKRIDKISEIMSLLNGLRIHKR